MAKQKLQISDLLIRDDTVKNPFAVTPDAGAIQNFVPMHGKLTRVPFLPLFHDSASSSQVWKLFDFQFVHDGARNQQILIFKADGKIYKRIAGRELEIFPGKTSFVPLVAKPVVVCIADRLHVSDGSQYLIYDGWDWFTGGLQAPPAPGYVKVAGSLTGTYKIMTTVIHIRNGVRIHESSHSPVVTVSVSSQDINVTANANGSLDPRATHFDIYVSELDGSDVYRRQPGQFTVNGGYDVNQAGSPVTVMSLSSPTAPIAPVRNDPVKPTKVMTQWKNRIAMRDEAATSNLWFTAYAEVLGLLNGAPDECLPGRASQSISDIVNSWTLPDAGEQMIAAVWHEEFLWVASNKNVYMIRGEGSLLDTTAVRDFYPEHMFNFGAASATAMLSTPYGLVVLSNDRILNLWTGEGPTIDIGQAIQTRLNALSSADLANLEMQFWDGGGNDWLILILGDRIEIFNFEVVTQDSPKGIWFSVGTELPTCTALGQLNMQGAQYLIAGFSDGTVRLIDNDRDHGIAVHQPAHLNLSFILGSTYLGSTVQSSQTGLARTGSMHPAQGKWTEGLYLELFHRGVNDTDATGIRPATPTIKAYYDDVNPISPDGAVTLTANQIATKEKRAWLRPSASQSSAGALAKRFQFEIGMSSTTTDGQVRPQLVNDEVLQFGFAFVDRSDLVL